MSSNNDIIIKSARLLKSIGHPIRIKIIMVLGEQTNMTVTDLTQCLLIDQPVVSLHLGVLRKQRIIKAEKRGKQSVYSILDTTVKQIVALAYNTRK